VRQQGRHKTCPYMFGWAAVGWVVYDQGRHKTCPYGV